MKNFTIILLIIALLILAGSTNVFAQRIEVTVAGTGTAGYTGNDGSGRTANIDSPSDVCVDAAKNLYFTDRVNGTIRKLTALTGVITTIAGGGTSFADGVPAITASLSPNFLCISPSGYLYVTTANEIRKINLATGIITTVAGNATAGFSGDGGPATAATLSGLEGICIDAAGNLYVAERWSARVRKISAATGIITTFAGTGVPGYGGDGGPATADTLNNPIAVCINSVGDLFIADQDMNYPTYPDNSVIRKISGATGISSTIAGSLTSGPSSGVPALNAFLGAITGMCVDRAGNIFCNEMSCSCRELNIVTDTLDLIAGNFGIESFADDTNCTQAWMNVPLGICIDNSENIYIADGANNRIRKLILLTHTPTFAFGPGQYTDPVAGTATPIDSLLWITDLDSAQTETWTVVRAPVYGTLAGFPATALSVGALTTVKPSGLSYTPLPSYADSDQFQVSVSDGLLSDTITIYVGAKSVTQSVKNMTVAGPAINIFPNPATSVLNIQWTNLPAGNASVVISDAAGRVLYNNNTAIMGSSNSGTIQTNVSAFPTGLYLVKVNGSEVRKFAKE